jgi:hypothetical protein
LILLGIIFYYFSSISTPLLDDEIAAYGVPALRLNENWNRLLPWNFSPHDFFGHPPLNTIYYALTLDLFPKSIEALRVASLLLSLIGVFAFYEIGKTLRSAALGQLLMLLYLSHFIFWENADLIFADNLFQMLFLLFLLSYLKNWRGRIMLFGVGMILTRETALIPIFVLCCVDWLKSRRNEDNLFPRLAILVGLQLAWFLFLLLNTGTVTPVYHDVGFIFKGRFILNTLRYILTTNFFENYWFLTLSFLFIGQPREVFKKYWGFIAIPIIFSLGLSTITQSLSRYQTVALSSWIIFIGLTISNQNLSKRLKLFVFGVISVIFIRNIFIVDKIRSLNKHFQELTYGCAEKVKEANLVGQVAIVGWPIYDLVQSLESLKSLSWHPPVGHSPYIHSKILFESSPMYDYLVTFDFAQTNSDVMFIKKIKASHDHELLSQQDLNASCLIFKRIK